MGRPIKIYGCVVVSILHNVHRG